MTRQRLAGAGDTASSQPLPSYSPTFSAPPDPGTRVCKLCSQHGPSFPVLVRAQALRSDLAQVHSLFLLRMCPAPHTKATSEIPEE